MTRSPSSLTPEQIAALRRGAAVSEWDRKQDRRWVVNLHLAVGDEHGNHTGRVMSIEVLTPRAGEICIGLESKYWDWGPVCRRLAEDTRLRIGRRVFPILGYQTWVGNWCWDSALVTAWTAAEILNWLRLQDCWHLDGAWQEMWDKWEWAEPFKSGNFAQGVGRLLRERRHLHGNLASGV